MTTQKYLPATKEFTSTVTDLFSFLNVVHASADRSEFVEAIRGCYFADHCSRHANDQERLKCQLKLSGNVLIGLRSYRLVERDSVSLTRLGEVLRRLGDLDREDRAKCLFAGHLIDNLCGQEVLIAMDRLRARGVSVRKKKDLSEELNSLGIRSQKNKPISSGTTDHTKLATWLRWCGVLDDEDHIVEEKFKSAVRRPSGLTSTLWNLSDEQFLFLRHLWRRTLASNEQTFLVKNLISESSAEYGQYISRPDQVRSMIIRPLQEAGFFELLLPSGGRGGNSGSVKVTSLVSELTARDFEQKNKFYASQPKVTKSRDQIFSELESDDIHIKGVALEELAIVLGQGLGLEFMGFRQMGNDTGGAEVDVIFEQTGIFYSKWLVQCKNTPQRAIPVSEVAKEVGNAVVNGANGIIMVTTGEYKKTVKTYAEATMRRSNLQVLLIDGTDLNAYRSGGVAALARVLCRQTTEISQLKHQDSETPALV